MFSASAFNRMKVTYQPLSNAHQGTEGYVYEEQRNVDPHTDYEKYEMTV